MSEAQNTQEATEENPPDKPQGRWCLVANFGKEHANAARPPECRHLPPGAKVYISRFYWDWDYDRAEILIKDRRNQRWFIVITAAHWLENFRVVLEYSPSVRRRLDTQRFMGGYEESDVMECRQEAEKGNQKAVEFAIKRVTRRHAPPKEPEKANVE